jgi:hypothetical protein
LYKLRQSESNFAHKGKIQVILLSSGCSFSFKEIEFTKWPEWTSDYIGAEHICVGMGSQGNGLIFKKAVHKLSELLKTVAADDILVGIMWSHPSRGEVFVDDYLNAHTTVPNDIENPRRIPDNSRSGWAMTNAEWTDKQSRHFYKYNNDEVYFMIRSLEYMLHMQWILKYHRIKYFMSTYTGRVFENLQHPSVSYLYDMLDKTHFLPVDGELDWCIEHSTTAIPNSNHPSTEQHKEFTQQVILPFLKQLYGISGE